MAEFPDLLINPNPNAPTLDASGNQVRGINIFETTAERDALNITVRIPGALAVIKGSDELYQYTADTVDDTAWQNANNWLVIGSSGGGGGTEGEDLSLNVRSNPYTGAGDHEGTVLSIGTLGLTVGTVYLWNGTEWADANAGAAATASGLMGIATDTGVAPDVLVSGIIQLASVPGSAGDVLYLNTTTNGTLTNDVSAFTQGQIVRVMGYNLDGNRIYFNPSQDWIELA